jgi:hypothetical protein
MPLQNCMNFPVSTSYVRTKASRPSLPIRYTLKPAASVVTVVPSRTAIGRMLTATNRRPLASMLKVRRWIVRTSLCWSSVGSPVGLVDRENRYVVLAAVGHLRALEGDRPGIAVGHIDEPPRGMDVDRTRGLPRAHIAEIGEGRRDE